MIESIIRSVIEDRDKREKNRRTHTWDQKTFRDWNGNLGWRWSCTICGVDSKKFIGNPQVCLPIVEIIE